MIKSVTITNYLGEKVKIILNQADPEHGFIVKKIGGLGPAKADIHRTNLATNDGSMFNSARLTDRNIVMTLKFVEAQSIEDTRQLSYKYFPIKKDLEFLIETDNRIVKTTGWVESNEPDIFSSSETAQISIICPDPWFYSAGENGLNTTVFYGVEPLFEFEFEDPLEETPSIEFGSIEHQTEQTIYYDGDGEIGVVIYIHCIGEASNITIYNTGTREIMSINTDMLETLTGSGLVASDEIIIDTTRNNKTIRLLRNGLYTNILNCLQRDCDWFTLSKGDNVFAYTAEAGEANLEFRIENRTIYEGV